MAKNHNHTARLELSKCDDIQSLIMTKASLFGDDKGGPGAFTSKAEKKKKAPLEERLC